MKEGLAAVKGIRVVLQPMPDGSNTVLLIHGLASIMLPLDLAKQVKDAIEHCLNVAQQRELMNLPAASNS